MDDAATQIALVIQKLDALARTTDSNHNEVCRLIQDHEARIRSLERNVTEISARNTMMQLIQGTFTAIASSVAALIGKS